MLKWEKTARHSYRATASRRYEIGLEKTTDRYVVTVDGSENSTGGEKGDGRFYYIKDAKALCEALETPSQVRNSRSPCTKVEENVRVARSAPLEPLKPLQTPNEENQPQPLELQEALKALSPQQVEDERLYLEYQTFKASLLDGFDRSPKAHCNICGATYVIGSPLRQRCPHYSRHLGILETRIIERARDRRWSEEKKQRELDSLRQRFTQSERKRLGLPQGPSWAPGFERDPETQELLPSEQGTQDLGLLLTGGEIHAIQYRWSEEHYLTPEQRAQKWSRAREQGRASANDLPMNLGDPDPWAGWNPQSFLSPESEEEIDFDTEDEFELPEEYYG